MRSVGVDRIVRPTPSPPRVLPRSPTVTEPVSPPLTPVGGRRYPLAQWQLLALRGEHPRLVPPPDMRIVGPCLQGSGLPFVRRPSCTGLRAQATQHLKRRRKREY